jgi:hypothetical protein
MRGGIAENGSETLSTKNVSTVQEPLTTYARAIGEPEASLFRLFPRHFESLLPPDPFDSLGIHLPDLAAQERRDPSVAVAAVLPFMNNAG